MLYSYENCFYLQSLKEIGKPELTRSPSFEFFQR